MRLRSAWNSGFVRLAVVAVVVVAVVLIAERSGREPEPPPSERAALERKRAREAVQGYKRRQRAELRKPAVRRERARLRIEQKPHFGSGEPGLDSRAAQDALLASLRRSITRDARSRYAAGKLNARATDTVCERLVRPDVPKPPPPPLGTVQAGYECTAVTDRVGGTSRNAPTIIGFPFWARVNFRTGRYAWCKINLQPSEGGIGGALATVPLEPVCDVLPEVGPA